MNLWGVHPDTDVPLVRDWDAVLVWNWVTAWGVSTECADVMFGARVDGPRLKDLYMAGYTDNKAEWAAVGVTTPRDLQAMNDACDYLRDTYWIVEEWVRCVAHFVNKPVCSPFELTVFLCPHKFVTQVVPGTDNKGIVPFEGVLRHPSTLT